MTRPTDWASEERLSYTLSAADDIIDGDQVPRSWDQTHSGKFLLGYTRDELGRLVETGVYHADFRGHFDLNSVAAALIPDHGGDRLEIDGRVHPPAAGGCDGELRRNVGLRAPRV